MGMLLFFPNHDKLFLVCFSFSEGPLAWALIVWRCSLVFSSIDKIISVLIHLLPDMFQRCQFEAGDGHGGCCKTKIDSAIPLDDPTIWRTSGVSYDAWICTLTQSLLEHSEDTILRLCQEILSIKAPLAELIFPHIFGCLPAEYEPDSELCTLISKQVEEHLFKDTNNSTRSLQLFLNTLDSLCHCFIHFDMKSVSPAPIGRESAKVCGPMSFTVESNLTIFSMSDSSYPSQQKAQILTIIVSWQVTSQLLRYEHEGNWGKALDNYDLLLRIVKPAQSRGRFTKMNIEEKCFPSKGGTLPNWQLLKGLMRTLQQKGCSHILEMYRCGILQQESGLRLDAEFKEMQD